MTSPESVVQAYLSAADAALPGMITGVYGYGSLVLDDWHPGVSDVDLLALTDGPLDTAALDGLAKIHAELDERPAVDVVYVPQSWATGDLPDDQRPTPFSLDGALYRDEPCGGLTPIIWLTAARYGRTFRGPAPEWTVDPERVRRYNLDNLRSYWAREAGWWRAALDGADPALELPGERVEWLVLGPPRLHYTLATGAVTSKSGAAQHVAGYFPDFAELAARCAARRRGEPVSFTAADQLAAIALTDAITADAWHRWA
jgi:Nucleotidyltransferase domain